MIRLFACIRRMIALDSASRILGAVAHDAIRKYMIPQVKKALRSAKTDSEQARLTELLAEYEKYSDPRTQESKLFGEIAERVIQGAVRQYNLQPSEEDELASQVAFEFYSPLREGSKPMMYALSKHRVDEGPVGLSKYFSHIVRMRADHLLKKTMRRYDMAQFQHRSEEPDAEGPLEREHAPGASPSYSESDYAAIRKDMVDYVTRNARDKITSALFIEWMRNNAKKGADHVNMKQDVYAPLMHMYDVSNSGLNQRFMEIKRLIESFFNKELGIRLTDALRKKLHIGSVDALAFEEFRHRFAAWMLCLPSA